jgi:hypothetical protein
MACLVPQGGEQRKWFRGRGFSGGGRWRLGAEVTGGPDRDGGVECVSAAASRESMTTTKPVSADRTACRTTVAEFSWMLEDNLDILKPLEIFGGRIYRRYRLVARSLV